MIRLSKNVMVYYPHSRREDSEEYEERSVESLFEYLNEPVEVDQNFTLMDLFEILEREEELVSKVFSSQLGHYPLKLYIDEIRKPFQELDYVKDIECLELTRYGEYWEGEVETYSDFCGVNSKDWFGYSVEFSPLNAIKHLPIRINKEFSITDLFIPSKFTRFLVGVGKRIGLPLKRWKDPWTYSYVRGETSITLYEVISAILYEISFCGSPEERDGFWERTKDDIVEEMEKYKQDVIQEMIDSGGG